MKAKEIIEAWEKHLAQLALQPAVANSLDRTRAIQAAQRSLESQREAITENRELHHPALSTRDSDFLAACGIKPF